MARKLRVQFPGAIYHITLRGVGRCNIFLDDRDRERFVERIADGVEIDEVRVYMFCLMTNHVHLLVETPMGNLSRFMHRIETGHSVFFNRRHNRSGHLTQGRYDAKLVEGDEYLLKLSRYLHLNPVCIRRMRALPLKERVEKLRKYQWSSYRSYVGLAKELEWIDCEPIRGMMPGRKSGHKQEYRKFVESGLAETDDEFLAMLKASPLSIGSVGFMEKIRDMHTELTMGHARPEDVAFRKTSRALGVDEVVAETCRALGVEEDELVRQRRDSLTRPLLARMLCRHAGLSQREVADKMGLRTGAAVSQQLARLADTARENSDLRLQISGTTGSALKLVIKGCAKVSGCVVWGHGSQA